MNEESKCVGGLRYTAQYPQDTALVNDKREIRIQPVLNGYTVDVGCKRVVFETAGKLLEELDRYLLNPRAVEHEYLEKYEKKTEV
jgi:hypothetical protein